MIGKVIEDTEAFLMDDIKFKYHAVTKDWVTNEIFRRVEPKGRTMGEYFEQEIQGKLTNDVFLRMNKEDLSKYYDYKTIGIKKYY